MARLGQIVSSDEAMALAIAEAQKGLATVGDNPAVGCVITSSQGKLLATGYHKVSGQDHAEVVALKSLPEGTDLTGGHMYVTLEPCAFEGRTGSCAKKIAELPLASVTVGLLDPHPKVNGEGVKILERSGKKVNLFEGHQAELKKLIEVFVYALKEKKTFVSLKMATTLDGQIALSTGESQWITSEKAREHGHIVRSHHDAILVGRNTLQWDNPKLNIRYGDHQDKKMKIVVLDPRARAVSDLLQSNLLQVHGAGNVVLVVAEDSEETIPQELSILRVKTLSNGQVDLLRLKTELFAKGIRSLLVEGGGATYSAFFMQRAVQRVYQYMALAYLGSAGGISSTSGMQVLRMKDQVRLKDPIVTRLEPDLLVTGRVDE